MIKLIMFVFLISGSAFAGLCSDSSLTKAKDTYAQAIQEKTSGVATQYDVLMAEKNVLDIELCINADDLSALSSLATNVNARLGALTSAKAANMATANDVSVVENEKTSLRSLCANTLLPSIQEQAKMGLANVSDIKATAATCDSLK